MKRWFAVILLASMPAFAQQAPKAPQNSPQLSSAERIALQDSERAKQELQKQWQDIIDQERAVLQEFAVAHPGFHINPQTLLVEADPAKPETKAAAPVAAPAKK